MHYKEIIYVFFILIFIGTASCLPLNLISGNKNKRVLICSGIRSLDTLCIIEPFTKVYVTRVNKNDFNIFKSEYSVFVNPPDSSKRFPAGEKKLNNYVKATYQKYLTIFQYKTNLKITGDDSLVIVRQMEYIKHMLNIGSFKDLRMSDTLYNVLVKYHYKQFLITDIIEYFYVDMTLGFNVTNWNRLFIFNMLNKSLSFYDYRFGSVEIPSGILMFKNSTLKLKKKSIGEISQYNADALDRPDEPDFPAYANRINRYYNWDVIIKGYNNNIKDSCKNNIN